MIVMDDRLLEIVRQSAEEEDFKFHILPVLKNAKTLCESYNEADRNVVEASAILHDIGRLKFGPENHEKTGAEEAVKILKTFGYEENFITKVKDCILSHRSGGKGFDSKEAEIVANADVMSHFDMVPLFIWWKTGKGESIEDTAEWILEKLDRDVKTKLTLPEAKKAVEGKHENIKLLLGHFANR